MLQQRGVEKMQHPSLEKCILKKKKGFTEMTYVDKVPVLGLGSTPKFE